MTGRHAVPLEPLWVRVRRVTLAVLALAFGIAAMPVLSLFVH